MTTVQPGQADAFVDSIGVDTKFSFNASPSVLLYPLVSSELLASGIRHIRDGYAPNGGYLSRLAPLGQHGINHSLEIYPGDTAAGITSKLKTFAPYVDFVEPQNEYDLIGGANWAPTIVALQKLIYSTVRGNPAFNDIEVLGPSLSNAAHAAQLGPLDAYEDAGNLHYSMCSFNPGTTAPSQALSRWIAFERASTTYKPIVSTEVDLSDAVGQRCGLPDSVIAKYTPRTVGERWNAGMPRSYFFEFIDTPGNGVWSNNGLLFGNASRKPQYATLTSLIALLSDPGGRFVTTPLTYSLTGSTANVHTVVLQTRLRVDYLLAWIELPDIDPYTSAPLTVAPQNVTLNFTRNVAAWQYTYAANGTLVSKALRGGSALPITVTDAVSVVKFHF